MPKLVRTLIILLTTAILGCDENISTDTLVYENTFATNDLPLISGGITHSIDNNKLLGPYNFGGFTLKLTDLPKHKYVLISFDLLIHDSWDGISISPNGPDIWGMRVNNFENQSEPSYSFTTTFSNGPCVSSYCYKQSFPDEYPTIHDPKTSAFSFSNGLCHLSSNSAATSIYKIEKVFKNTDRLLFIEFYDRLVQDNVRNKLCDESWSLDNLRVSVLN